MSERGIQMKVVEPDGERERSQSKRRKTGAEQNQRVWSCFPSLHLLCCEEEPLTVRFMTYRCAAGPCDITLGVVTGTTLAHAACDLYQRECCMATSSGCRVMREAKQEVR